MRVTEVHTSTCGRTSRPRSLCTHQYGRTCEQLLADSTMHASEGSLERVEFLRPEGGNNLLKHHS